MNNLLQYVLGLSYHQRREMFRSSSIKEHSNLLRIPLGRTVDQVEFIRGVLCSQTLIRILCGKSHLSIRRKDPGLFDAIQFPFKDTLDPEASPVHLGMAD